MAPAKASRKPTTVPDLIAAVAPAVALVKVTASGGGGIGSAFAIKSTAAGRRAAGGYVMATNAHVVSGRNPSITARFSGGYDQTATVILIDEVTDVALLRVAERPLRELQLRDTKTVRLGESIFAIGNPYGFECSVSQGIVSGLERSTPMSDPNELRIAEHRISGDMIQTDAKILQGNSGGPLIDATGSVVAMATRGYAPSNAYKHATMINLAVASSTISKHVREFLEFGDPFIQRASIGASVGLHDFEADEQPVWRRRAGAKILEITRPDGPAANAGLKKGDVVIEFRGIEVDHFHDLQMNLDRWAIGTDCEIAVVRGDELIRTVITPSEAARRG